MTQVTAPQETKAPQDTETGEKRPSPPRWPWILVSLIVLAGVVVLLGYEEDTIDVSETSTPPPLPLITIEHASVTPQIAEIRSFAEVQPRWAAVLTSAVSGRVTKVFDQSLAGEPVEAGATLIEIENSRYAAELASAELALQQAQLSLWQAENATLLARKDYERNNRKPPNDLALKLPQLAIAKSSVTAAEARVLAAKRQLADTTITAPFSAYVTERFVSPGQSVNAGDRLVKLADNKKFELVAELGRNDWKLASKPLAGKVASVFDQDGNKIAEARIRGGGGFLDENTRQYKVFLEIQDPEQGQVLSGDFVTVLLPGQIIPEALDVPASSLTQEGYVWYVDTEDRLQRMEPRVLFRREDRVIILPPANTKNWQIATTPLVSYLPGQNVRTREQEE